MWIIKAWQHISLEVSVQSFKKCRISNAMNGTNDDSCRMAVKSVGMLALGVRKMQALTVKMEALTVKMQALTSKTETLSLIGKGRQNLTCFVY
jgi:hypothetical protein